MLVNRRALGGAVQLNGPLPKGVLVLLLLDGLNETLAPGLPPFYLGRTVHFLLFRVENNRRREVLDGWLLS